MARIAVLPDTIASRIAAGEVVERPASALKELIENAIDAGSRTIEVSLVSGGRDALIVTDDGEGMSPDDLLLSLERHATSKIHSDGDIEQVRTLGFRGEAVPAIASVSRFRMSSRDAGSDAASVVEIHAGRLVSVSEESAPRGTRVEVAAIFYNAPARRKFLRAAETERQRCAEVVARFAIGYPSVRFRLIADDRLLFDHAPVAGAIERCAQVFGRQLTDTLLPVHAESGPLRLTGLCSGISETRSHSREQHVYVNRRPVRDRLLTHAVSSAYAEALPRGRYPVVILLLDLPPEMVDVNVHPAKSEVRFRRPSEIHDFLTRTLQDRLRTAGAVPAMSIESFPPRGPAADREDPSGSVQFLDGDARPATSGAGLFRQGATTEGARLPGSSGVTYIPGRFGASGSAVEPWQAPEGWIASRPDTVSELGKGGSREAAAVPLGQFLDSYILASSGGALLLVDQHAAHERILFEKITGEGEGRPSEVQRLLEPVIVELGHGESGGAEDWLAPLGSAGFEAELFGEDALLLRGVPAGLEAADPGRLVRDVVSDLREGAAMAEPAARDRRLAATIACHAAIKVRFPLTAQKMAWLLTELFLCATPTTCPHGRPAILRIGLDEIERGFHRR